MSPGLQLSLSEYEQNEAEKGDYLAFVATTSQYGFAGRTLFWVSRDYLESFISELDALDATLRGEARLRCGWGDDVLFELAILSEGHGGRLRVKIGITSDSRSVESSQLVTTFVIMPNTLTSFRKALSDILFTKAPGVAELAIDPESAV